MKARIALTLALMLGAGLAYAKEKLPFKIGVVVRIGRFPTPNALHYIRQWEKELGKRFTVVPYNPEDIIWNDSGFEYRGAADLVVIPLGNEAVSTGVTTETTYRGTSTGSATAHDRGGDFVTAEGSSQHSGKSTTRQEEGFAGVVKAGVFVVDGEFRSPAGHSQPVQVFAGRGTSVMGKLMTGRDYADFDKAVTSVVKQLEEWAKQNQAALTKAIQDARQQP